jgi:diguanylate cyclase (GGDEF)-like protein/PAS domain S-box-containing protein
MLLFLVAIPALMAGPAPSRKNILILHSYSEEYRWTADINDGMLRTLGTMSDPKLVCVEYLDWKRFPDETHLRGALDYIRAKYASTKFNLILTSDDKALESACELRRWAWPFAPVVFTGVYPESVEALTGGAPNITGVYEEQDVETTVRYAISLAKTPRAAYIVSERSESGQAVERHIADALRRLAPDLRVESLGDRPVDGIVDAVAAMDRRDLLFIGSYSFDAEGATFSGETLIGRIGMASGTPLFVLNTHHLGNGAFGGRLLSPSLLGENAGLLAVRILSGERADSIKPLSAASYVALFDWNAVVRYGIKPGDLPTEAKFIHREESFFEKYKYEAILVSATLIALLVGLSLTFALYMKTRMMARSLAERNGEILALNKTMSDVDEELRRQFDETTRVRATLEESEMRHTLALLGSNDAIWDQTYPDGAENFSDRWYEMTGFTRDEREADCLMDAIIGEDRPLLKKSFLDHVDGKTDHISVEVRIKTASGRNKWVLLRCKSQKTGTGDSLRLAGSITDIDGRKTREAEIENLAFYDQLTSLPNRALALRETRTALESLDEGKQCALIFVNLDNFKYINDTFGHGVGDRVLMQAAQELSSLVAENVHLSRFGGDEFSVLIEDATVEQAEKYGKLAIRLLSRRMEIDGRYHYLTASAGIALYPDHARTQEELFQKADVALHRAKDGGKSRCFVFDSAVQQELVERMEMASCLRTAIDHGEMLIAYQPQVDLRTKKVSGFEALARWNSPRLGNVPPEVFIPIAEDAWMIDSIGLFVVEGAAKFIKRAETAGFSGFMVSVNVSVRQLGDAEFINRVLRILKAYDVEPGRIAIEITESFMIDDLGPVVALLQRLRDEGFVLSLDDFGKGYSSLSYLRSLPLDYLKIDKCFIDDIVSDRKAVPLARNIIELSHQLGLKVVAEGVEVREQIDYLRDNECDYIQGFYYSKPGTEDAALENLTLSFH